MVVVVGIIAKTELSEIVNDHPPFEMSILMSAVVLFVPREWAGRKNSYVLCYSSIEHSPNGEKGCDIVTIP
jgi:hypothetical protein